MSNSKYTLLDKCWDSVFDSAQQSKQTILLVYANEGSGITSTQGLVSFSTTTTCGWHDDFKHFHVGDACLLHAEVFSYTLVLDEDDGCWIPNTSSVQAGPNLEIALTYTESFVYAGAGDSGAYLMNQQIINRSVTVHKE